MYTSDIVDAIIQAENGELGRDGYIHLFQHLVDTGLAWQLQGSYGREARRLLEAGLIHPPVEYGDAREGET